MILYVFYPVLACSWIFSIVAPLLAIRWSSRQPRQRFSRSLKFSLSTIVLGVLGTTLFYVTSTRTDTDGRVTSYDSRWFFATSLALGIFALAYAIWKRRGAIDAA